MHEADILRPSWCEIDLSAVRDNVEILRRLVGPKVSIFACLKNDACGCGAIPVAKACEKAGIDGFAFGDVDKAIACREAGTTAPILLYTPIMSAAAVMLSKHKIMPTLSTVDEVRDWDVELSEPLSVFLKIDSGSFRVGAFPMDALEVAKKIVRSKGLSLAGVYGHTMADYGFDRPGYERDQLNAFMKCVAEIESSGIRAPIKMVSSSATVLKYPDIDLNGIDPGRLLLGLPFDAIHERTVKWRSALCAIKSQIVLIKDIPDGVEAPYPPFFEKPGPGRIGLIPFGWGDGYPVSLKAQAFVLVNGDRVPVLEPVHSEIMRLDLSDCPSAVAGDEVVILGASGDLCIDLGALAEMWRVDFFSIYNAIGKSLLRVYLNE